MAAALSARPSRRTPPRTLRAECHRGCDSAAPDEVRSSRRRGSLGVRWPLLLACCPGALGVRNSHVPPGEAVQGPSGCALRCEADFYCEKSFFDTKTKRCEVTLKASKPPRKPPRKEESTFGGPMHKVLLVTYANGERFETTQRLLGESIETAEIEEHWAWNASTFEQPEHADWSAKHSRANFPRGGAWKPYVIWEAFRRVEWDDWLVYHDASQYIQEGLKSSIQPLLWWLEQQRAWQPCQCIPATRLRQTFQHEWENRCIPAYSTLPRDFGQAFDIFCGALLRTGICGLDDSAKCCRETWESSVTHQHSWSIWRKNMHSARFLHEWLLHSQDVETVSRLPLIDQSVNAMLVYKWRTELQLKTLWVPSIYEVGWDQEMDLGSMGRIGASLHKHINLLIDALWNSAAERKHRVWLIDPATPPNRLVEDGMGSRDMAIWSKAIASSHASWERSLCLRRQPLAPRIVAAEVRRVWKLDEKAIPLTRRFKDPVAWPSLERRWHSAAAEEPSEKIRLVIPYVLVVGEPHFEECNRTVPWAQPGADCFLLASLKVGDPFLKKQPAVPGGFVLLWAGVVFLNEGYEPWPEGMQLCLAGGNATEYLQWGSSCQSEGAQVEDACPRVPPGDIVQLELSIQFFARGLWQKLETHHGRLFVDAIWTLCLPSKTAGSSGGRSGGGGGLQVGMKSNSSRSTSSSSSSSGEGTAQGGAEGDGESEGEQEQREMVGFGSLVRLRFVLERPDEEFVAAMTQRTMPR